MNGADALPDKRSSSSRLPCQSSSCLVAGAGAGPWLRVRGSDLDAARGGARYIAGKTSLTDGPGLASMCSLITADLAATTTNVSCATLVAHAPPFVVGTDYANPTGGQAVVVVSCGTSVDCRGTPNPLFQSQIDVYVYYGFNDLNLFGGRITISGSSRTTTSW